MQALAQGGIAGGHLGDQLASGSGGHIVRRPHRGLFQFLAELAHLCVGAGEQARDLRFQGARVHDLTQRRVGGQRQQIASHVEGARA